MSSQVSQEEKKIKVKYFLSTLQPEIFSAANVTITFATEQPDGVLFYFGDYQHLAVELFKWVKYFLSAFAANKKPQYQTN